MKRIAPPNTFRKKRTSWDEIYNDDAPSGMSPSLPHSIDLSRGTSATVLLHATSFYGGGGSELLTYSECDTVSQLDGDSNILK